MQAMNLDHNRPHTQNDMLNSHTIGVVQELPTLKFRAPPMFGWARAGNLGPAETHPLTAKFGHFRTCDVHALTENIPWFS